MDIDKHVNTLLPDDIHQVRVGIYMSASTPEIIWFNPIEVLASLGEEPTFEYIGALSSALIESYEKEGIEALVIGDE